MFKPSDVEKREVVKTELPSERLKLEWVYPSLCTQGALRPHACLEQSRLTL